MARSTRNVLTNFTGEREKYEPMVIVNKKVVCNELLSNVLRGIMHGMEADAMADIIEQNFESDATYDARKILFKNFFNLFPQDPNDPNELQNEEGQMGAKEKEIKKKWNVEDIIKKMMVIANLEHDIEFCVTWDYKYVIVTDEEKKIRELIKEKDKEIDAKFSALEKVIELQNRATIMAVESVMKEALENVKDVINEKKIEGISTPIFEQAEFFKGRDFMEQSGVIHERYCQDLQSLRE